MPANRSGGSGSRRRSPIWPCTWHRRKRSLSMVRSRRSTVDGPRPDLTTVIEYSAMASQPQLTLDEIKLAMARTNELFNTEIVGKRNFEALDEIYTSDARILPPDVPMISGREGIKKFWSDLIQAMDPKSAVLESLGVIPTGEG